MTREKERKGCHRSMMAAKPMFFDHPLFVPIFYSMCASDDRYSVIEISVANKLEFSSDVIKKVHPLKSRDS